MKKYKKINKATYKEYDKKYFMEMLAIFLDFLDLAKLDQFEYPCTGLSDQMKYNFLMFEFKEIIDNCMYKYPVFDEETDKMVGFIILDEGKIISNALEVHFVAKYQKVSYCKALGDVFREVCVKHKEDRPVIALLGKRDKNTKYHIFLKRVFGITEIIETRLGETVVEFNI